MSRSLPALEDEPRYSELLTALKVPAPCDDCRHVAQCARGYSCEAFNRFVDNPNRWHLAARQPRADIYARLFQRPLKRAA